MLQGLVILIVVLLSLPIGLLVAWMTRDELKDGRKYFKIIIAVSFLLIIFSYSMTQFILLFIFIFILLFTLVSLVKSYDKKWTKRKI